MSFEVSILLAVVPRVAANRELKSISNPSQSHPFRPFPTLGPSRLIVRQEWFQLQKGNMQVFTADTSVRCARPDFQRVFRDGVRQEHAARPP